MKSSAIVGLALLFAGFVLPTANQAQEKKVDTRVFELRTYTVYPDKMKDMHARFRDHTCKLLEKHGMTLLGFWTPIDEKGAQEKLVYLVAHKSKAAADASWAAFRADPDWIKARDASEAPGKIVVKVEASFFNPTDYSALK